jgi:hypothetical protein
MYKIFLIRIFSSIIAITCGTYLLWGWYATILALGICGFALGLYDHSAYRMGND